MSNTTPADHRARRCATALAVALGVMTAASNLACAQETRPMNPTQANASETLTARQQAIVPIAAFAAAGDMAKLNGALNRGLDAGMTISDAREILVQLYAYAGFPRSLNALGELMKVLDARKQRGIQDAPGSAPSRSVPKGDALLAELRKRKTAWLAARIAELDDDQRARLAAALDVLEALAREDPA